MGVRVEGIGGMAPWAQKQILEKLKKNTEPETEKTSQASASKNKFGNQPTESRGIRFDSKKEAARFEQLILLQQAGVISDLRLQQNFTLQEAYTKPDGERVRSIVYKADFTYRDATGALVVEDVKSKATRTKVYIIKKKMLQEKFGIEIIEV